MIYVHPGQSAVSRGPRVLTTILGSCVAVCLHDPRTGLGGMNHYLLPSPGAEADQPGRYGPTAIAALVHQMVTRGASREGLVAHVVGGASVLTAFAGLGALGLRNIRVAHAALAEHGIPVIGVDVGGSRGRKVHFAPRDGAIHVQLIGS
jgi:chemotaxis protein CheD